MKPRLMERSEHKSLAEFDPALLAERKGMHYVYVFQSGRNKEKIYIGHTDDVKRRLSEHNLGKNYSTKLGRPYRIVYYEAFLNKYDALDRERKLKHHGSVIGHLKRRIERSLLT